MKIPFAAALLAGGASKRMGRDKALLQISWCGRHIPLWEKQLILLAEAGPQSLFISGNKKSAYPAALTIVPDQWSKCGPLGGLTTILHHINEPQLLVLPVDLPYLDVGFIHALLNRCNDQCGVVPRAKNRYEPLVAIYPKQAKEIALQQIIGGDLRLQDFVERLHSAHLVKIWNVPAKDFPQLRNWNSPADLRSRSSAES